MHSWSRSFVHSGTILAFLIRNLSHFTMYLYPHIACFALYGLNVESFLTVTGHHPAPSQPPLHHPPGHHPPGHYPPEHQSLRHYPPRTLLTWILPHTRTLPTWTLLPYQNITHPYITHLDITHLDITHLDSIPILGQHPPRHYLHTRTLPTW